MNPKEHILQSLKELKIDHIENQNNQKDLSQLIYKFLLSKKFRKYAITPEYQEHILLAIKNSISKNEPIKLTLVFGGYKLWRLEETPEVDWAELFSIIYYTKWLKPILSIYKPGVWFDFFSDDVIVDIMNNIPKKDLEKYAESFKNLLKFIKPYLPENLLFTFNRVGDQYENYELFKKDLNNSIEEIKQNVKNTLTQNQIQAIELNVKTKPGQSGDLMWREKINIIHDGYARISKRRPYYRNPDKILVITRPVKDSIAVGSTKRSVVKFWIGAGVLKMDGDKYVDYIYSPKQLESNSLIRETIHIEGLEGKNFQTIKIAKN